MIEGQAKSYTPLYPAEKFWDSESTENLTLKEEGKAKAASFMPWPWA